jgi:hypothetical protein
MLPAASTEAGRPVDEAGPHAGGLHKEGSLPEGAVAEFPPGSGRYVQLTEALQHRTSSTIATAGSSEEATTVAGSDLGTVHEASPAPENGSSARQEEAGDRGAAHLPATSLDADPFQETDQGLKVVAAGQARVRTCNLLCDRRPEAVSCFAKVADAEPERLGCRARTKTRWPRRT